MSDYCKDKLLRDPDSNGVKETLDFMSNSAEKIRRDFRNPSAHPERITKVQADECNKYVLDVQKILIRLMEIFR